MLHLHRFIAFLPLFIFSLVLQAQPSTYIVHLGIGSTATHKDLLMFPNGDLIMTGTINYPYEGFLARFDNDGQRIWSGLLPVGDQFERVYQGPGEHFFATGMRDTSGTDPRILVGYFDGNGQNLWLKTLDDGKYHFSSRGTVLGNGNLVVVAGGESTFGSHDYIASLDTLGNIVWEKCYDPSFAPKVAAVHQNQVILAQHLNWNTHISLLDASGNVTWRTLVQMGMDEVSVFRDSTIYVAGTFLGFQDQSLLVEMDTNGLVTQAWDWSGLTNPGRIRFNARGEFLMAGTSLVENPGTGPYNQSAIGVYRPATGIYGLEGYQIYHGAQISQMWESPDGGYVVGHTNELLPHKIVLEKRDSLLSTQCDSVLLIPPVSPPNYPVSGSPAVASTYPVSNSRNLPTVTLTTNNLGYTIDCAVGIATQKPVNLECWPNPATHTLNLNWNKTEMGLGSLQMEIWSSAGQMVLATDLENDGSENILLDRLGSGCYHIRLFGANDVAGSLTFIKD